MEFADGERPADPEQRPRLALACDRVLGSSPLQRGKLADNDSDEQQEEQVHELARLRDGERVAWVDEQEVVEEERRDRREDRAPRPRHDGCRNDGDEVQRRWVGHLETVLQHGDSDRCGRQREGSDGTQADQLASIGASRPSLCQNIVAHASQPGRTSTHLSNIPLLPRRHGTC